MREWQAFDQPGIHVTEDGSVRADAERERENRDDGKARTAQQHARGEADILRERPDEIYAAGVAALFLYLIEAAELETGGAQRLLARAYMDNGQPALAEQALRAALDAHGDTN